MRIAFLYIAEAYQCYHGAAIAFELARRPGVEVTIFYNDPDTPHHLERIRQAYGEAVLPAHRLRRSPLTRALQAIRRLGMQKTLVMLDNRKTLDTFDLVFGVENSIAALRTVGVRRPALAYATHGSGDRARGFIKRIAAFDLVLLSGAKTEKRMLAEGLIRPGHYALPGYVKFETAERLYRAGKPLFPASRPTILYNPHKAPELESWSRFIEPMLAQFSAQDDFNLIVAPHVKMFRRRTPEVRRQWEERSRDNILIDLGSDRSVDMTYTEAADIYIGDISSQVYEFLVRPRPCIFLNAHGVDWRNDPSFLHWHFGEVVDDPKDLMAAVRRARDLHPRYAPLQEKIAAETLGDRSPGIARRAADAVMRLLENGHV